MIFGFHIFETIGNIRMIKRKDLSQEEKKKIENAFAEGVTASDIA